MISRRGFIAGIIAAGVAPLVLGAGKAGILLPPKPKLLGLDWFTYTKVVILNDGWLHPNENGDYILVAHPDNAEAMRAAYPNIPVHESALLPMPSALYSVKHYERPIIVDNLEDLTDG